MRHAHTAATYTDNAGRERELVIRSGAHDSLLVLDRDFATLCDQRLVAHIPADEPLENALLVCRMYALEQGARPCRPLRAEDLMRAPIPSVLEEEKDGEGEGEEDALCGASSISIVHEEDGARYMLRPQRAQRARRNEPPELRWHRRAAGASEWTALTLRDALAEIESYEPLRTLTLRATARHGDDAQLSVWCLRRELDRVQYSALVLNRALREAVLDAVKRRGLSLSEIALRCGMVKRNRQGRPSGDTSWLARRVGLMAECGKRAPSRWVHTDTLGLIARQGLRLSPREVELG